MATKKQEKEHLKKLMGKIEDIENTIKMGDKLFFNYDGKQVAEYQFVEWSMDSKSPMDWFKGCVCFEVTMKGLDPTKVDIAFEKNTDPDIFKKMFGL
jgi:hypothetical protein